VADTQALDSRPKVGGRTLQGIFLETRPPAPSTSFDDAELVCLDIETTGLDPATVDMLSIGWVLIRGGRVDLSTAESHVVKPSGGLGNSPSIHGLTDSVVDQGMSPEEAMERVIEVLTGRILVVHHAGLDKKLLDRFCRQQFGDKLLVPVIDTLALLAAAARSPHALQPALVPWTRLPGRCHFHGRIADRNGREPRRPDHARRSLLSRRGPCAFCRMVGYPSVF
jgi:DNA polymerase III epsilon subunit-like protein